MQKIQFYFVLVIFIVCNYLSFSKPSSSESMGDYMLVYLHYENSSGEKGLTTFEYDKGNHPARALWQLLDGSRNSLNFYTYNDQGNMIKKYREFSDGKTSTQHFKYNTSGQLVGEDFFRSDGVKGEAKYLYDPKGSRIKAEGKNHLGWFTGVIEYQYDNNGTKTRAIIKRGKQVIGDIAYVYESHKMLKKEVWSFKTGWSQTFVYEYDFYPQRQPLAYTSSNVFLNTRSGYKVIKEKYDYSQKGGGPSDYFYQRDKLYKKTYTRSDGLKTVTYYFYDGDHHLIKSLRIYADGKSGIFTYTYNTAHRLLKRNFIRTDGAKAHEVYSYDQDVKLIKGVWKNYDSWLTGNLSFIHDKRGMIKEGFFKGQGDKKFNANIFFNYDQFDNVIRMHWKFSFKGSQTYTFEYQKIKSQQ